MTNDEIRYRIDQQIHKEHYRRILKRKLVDGITYEALAEEEDMSSRGIQEIVRKCKPIIFQ